MEKINNIEDKKRKFKPIHIIIISFIVIISFASVFLIGQTIIGNDNETEDGQKLGPVYQTSEFTVNLAETVGKRYLRAQFALELDHRRVSKELEAKSPILQDTVIMILSHQTIKDLDTVEGKEKIKVQLQDSINGFLDTGEVVNIYFNHFVWQ